MAERVRISSGVNSPLRVSAPGVNQAGAQFDDLIFDANAQPHRYLQISFGQVAFLDPANLSAIFTSGPIALAQSPPSGRQFKMLALGRSTVWSISNVPTTDSSYSSPKVGFGGVGSGMGAMIANNTNSVYAVTFSRLVPGVSIAGIWNIWIMVFKNAT